MLTASNRFWGLNPTGHQWDHFSSPDSHLKKEGILNDSGESSQHERDWVIFAKQPADDSPRVTQHVSPGGKFLALKQSDYYFHIFSRARIKLMVSALARCRVGSARLCSVRDCGDWPAEKERVFSVWSLAWEQSESGHHTTLWQPRGRQWRQHTPPRPCPAPDTCPFHADLLTHSHTDSPYACEYGHAHRRCPLKQIAISTKH